MRYREPRGRNVQELFPNLEWAFPYYIPQIFLWSKGRGKMPRKMFVGLYYIDSRERREHPFPTWAAILVNPDLCSHLLSIECGVLAIGVTLGGEKRALSSLGGQNG